MLHNILLHGDRQLYKSKPEKGKMPLWEDASFRVPTTVKEITVTVYESDKLGKDDMLGTCQVAVPIGKGEYPIGKPGSDISRRSE